MLTVLITAYNRPDALALAVESLAAQSLPRDQWNVLLVEDGSPEPASAAIAAIAKRSAVPIRHLRIPNGGPARARNIGIREATGEVVLIVNDDVILSPKHLERHWNAHRVNPARNWAAHGETVWHPDSLRGAHMRSLARRAFNYEIPIEEWERAFVYFVTSSLSVKRALLLDHPFDESFPSASFEDTELALRIVREEGLTVELLRGDPAYHWHYHTPPMFLRRAATNGRNAVRLLEKFPDFEYRLIGAHRVPGPKGRVLRAAACALRGDAEGMWEQLEMAAYLRAFWREVATRAQR